MAANITDKIPPQALDAEMAVLGAMLIEKEALNKVADIISENDFYKDLHRQVFNAILELDRFNLPIDIITLYDKLKKNGNFLEAGGASYLNSLVDMVQTAANVEQYAQIVRDKSILRQIVNAGSEMSTKAFNEALPAEELLDNSQKQLFDISLSQKSGEFTKIGELIHPTLAILEKLHSEKKSVTGVSTGFEKLDSLTAGFQPSDLIIIAARPSMGKTALGLNIAEHVSIKENKPVIVFSLEMSKEALTMRLLSSIGRVDGNKIRTGWFNTNNEWPNITAAAQKLSTAPLYIDDDSSATVMEMRARSRRLASRLAAAGTPLAMIMVDYIQIMNGGSGRKESRQIEVAEISRSLKGLAKDLKVPVVALAQLSRKSDERGKGAGSVNSEPILSDLRESGAIEQDADLVAFIHYKRPEFGDDSAISADLLIRKQRNGPIGNVPLLFERNFTKFSTRDYSRTEE
ncbi:MAG: replicative DNA helicase [Elusimicrobiota bacterium]|jgi:replicative DNA helicase|nr:replicative DNA helicase [Elusimicrobiota bacterium]